MSSGPNPVWDGSLDMLKRAAHLATARIRHTVVSRYELFDMAFSEACMLVAETPDADLYDVVNHAVREVSRECDRITGSHGQPRGDTSTGARFAMFWHQRLRHHDHYGIDHMALRQVWAALPEADRRVLMARAACPTNAEAARSIGISEGHMAKRYRQARRAAQALWFDWETPPPLKQNRARRTTHCPKGHSRDEHGQWVIDSHGNRVQRCGECNRQSAAAWRTKRKEPA